MLIAKNGQVIFSQGFGLADLQTREKITTHTIFNLGSISKTFVAYGILQLANEGKLSIDDRLTRFFPDFKHPKAIAGVRLFHLLTHSSGIPDSRPVETQREFYLTAKDEENFEPLKKTKWLQFEPGTHYRYSNPAFNGLALIIEKTTGYKWQQFIHDRIFVPAGMPTSTITDGPHPVSGVSHAYVRNAQQQFEELDYGEEPTFAAAGNGGVWSTVEELWNYEQAIQQHTFLPESWVQRSRMPYPLPQWKDSLPQRLGLSWFINLAANGHPMIGHTGSQGGFISDYCWWPEEKLFYVLLCNTPKPIMDIRRKLQDVFGIAHP